MQLNQSLEYNDIGVYYIQCIPNDKYYVGCTTNLKRRYQQHRNRLEGGIHDNSHLQSSWNKYGKDAFLFSVISYCDSLETASILEKSIIDEFDLFNNAKGFNQKCSGDYTLFSKDQRRNLSKSLKGRPSWKRGKTYEEIYGKEKSDRLKQHYSILAKNRPGIPLSAESKQQMSKSKKSNIEKYKETNPYLQSGENNPHYGKSLDEIYGKDKADKIKEKIKSAQKKKGHPFLGKSHNEETKKKLRRANLIRSVKCEFTDPEGSKHYPETFSGFCKENNLNIGAMFRVRKGKQSNHKGWTCKDLN